MRFSVEWLEDAPNAASEERSTACDLRIWINDQNVCLHLDGIDNALYDHVTMPVYSLAEGLVHDWWTIFGARDKEHKLIKYRMGYTAPDVRFRFDGAEFDACSCQHSYTNPDIRFWTVPAEVMSRQNAEIALATFIEGVITRLHDEGLHHTSAELRWTRVQESRSDLDEAIFCESAGALGADPYTVGQEEADFVAKSGDFFTGEPLIEFLAGVGELHYRQDTLEWIRHVESRPAYLSRLEHLGGLADQVSQTHPPLPGDRSWALGYKRARATRAALGRKSTDRVSNVSDLAKSLGNKSFRHADPIRGLRALILTRYGNVHIYLRDRPTTHEARVSEIFAFARAIGDAICFPRTPRSVVNELHEADRQAAGRAFAAEFLAPIDEILSMRDDDKDVATIADELNVSTAVIERQLENQHRIQAACSSAVS